MPVIHRPWVSPYGDDDFEWDRRKSLITFADRDFVFEAARIVFRGPLVRRQDTRRRRTAEPRFMVLGELYGRVMVITHRVTVNAVSFRCVQQTPRSVKFIMASRADKPREYFASVLDLTDGEIRGEQLGAPTGVHPVVARPPVRR